MLASIEFADIDEAIARANDTQYGLAAGIWTRDIKKAHYIARKLQAGTVWINTYNVYDTAAPFGGYKQSGFGREMSAHALRALHADQECLGGSEHVSWFAIRCSELELANRTGTDRCTDPLAAWRPNSRSSRPARTS